MRKWRGVSDRLGQWRKGHRRFRWWSLLILALLVAPMLSACAGGGARHESWPGLMVSDGTLYVANLEHVQALNAETGKVYWSFPEGESKKVQPFYSTPVLAESYGEHGFLLVAGFSDHTVYALALGASPAERPDEVWRFEGAGGQYVGTGTLAGGLFIIGNGDGSVYALNVEDGSEAWHFITRDRVWATPVVVGDTVYVASLDHHLYALDLASGNELWQTEMRGAIAGTPVVTAGSLWVGDFASTLYQVDLESGSILWTWEAADWLWATPAVADDVLYLADVSGHVYAFDAASHAFIWDAPSIVDDVIRGRPIVNQEDHLLIVPGYEKGKLYAIDTQTGKLRQDWGVTLENPGRLPGDLVADGTRLYTLPILVQERVQAFDLDSGELLWSSPQPTE